MAKRRKRTAKSTAQRSKLSSSNVKLDKSLPAIPPPEARKTAYIPESQSPYPEGYVDAPAEVPSVAKIMGELQRDTDSRPSTTDQNPPRGKGLTVRNVSSSY